MEQPKRTSIKDIAKYVGVSTALVSYVLNGLEKEKRVSPEVAGRIKEAVMLFNYTPNHFARSLRKGTTMTIGLIVTDIANPFFSNIARYVEDEAFKHGYTVIMGSSDEKKSISELLIKAFLDRQVDGFIIVPAEGSEPQIQKLIDINIPFVLLDRYFPILNTNYIILDNFNAAYKSINHLVSNSYKKIGMIAYKSHLIHMQERIRGYICAMKDNNLDSFISVREVRFDNLKNDVSKCIDEFTNKENKYEALLVATNHIAITLLYDIMDRDIRVPDDLAIVSFDSSEAFDFFYNPITYIRQPQEEMGRTSVRLLISKLKDNKITTHLEIEHELIIRKSSI